MRKKRQICKKFQIIYIKIPLLKKGNIIPHSLVQVMHSDFLPRNTVWKNITEREGKRATLQWGNLTTLPQPDDQD